MRSRACERALAIDDNNQTRSFRDDSLFRHSNILGWLQPRRLEWRRNIYRLLGDGAKAKDILAAISTGHHVLASEDRGAFSPSDERQTRIAPNAGDLAARARKHPWQLADAVIGTFRDLSSYLLGACRSAGATMTTMTVVFWLTILLMASLAGPTPPA